MAEKLTNSGERGHTIVLAIVVLVLTAAFGFAMIDAVISAKEEGAEIGAHQQRLFLAESGLDMALQDLQAGGSGVLGSATAPVRLGAGSFYTLAAVQEDGSHRVFSVGSYQGHNRVARARVRQTPHVFHHAIFAGNSSNDPDYELRFEGLGADADDVNGDIYSGGSVVVSDHADVSGDIRAQGAVSGAAGVTGLTQPSFDFEGVDLTAQGVVDVAAEFASSAATASSVAGGTAWQLPETHPAHVLRLNPSDRAAETVGTPKDDYFLEDPYEPVGGTSSLDDGSDNYMVTLDDGSGVTRRTFYIDGNLWIHSYKSYGLMIATSPDTGRQTTFIVRGNITFSDSFRIEDVDRDAVGFIALIDPNVEDSGNIYMGDPSFGTLKELHAFLYAENDFLDVNLSSSGSKSVRLLGSMTAGDKVAIERTHEGGHSKLTVDWDQRLQTGAVSLPFIDSNLPGGGGSTIVLEAWVESPVVPAAGAAPPGVPTAPADPPPTTPATDPVPVDEIVDPWWTPEWEERKIEYDQEAPSYDPDVYYKRLLDEGKIGTGTYYELVGTPSLEPIDIDNGTGGGAVEE